MEVRTIGCTRRRDGILTSGKVTGAGSVIHVVSRRDKHTDDVSMDYLGRSIKPRLNDKPFASAIMRWPYGHVSRRRTSRRNLRYVVVFGCLLSAVFTSRSAGYRRSHVSYQAAYCPVSRMSGS